MQAVARPVPVDPQTASSWRAEASARGLTLEQFLHVAVARLLTDDADRQPTRHAGAAPSRSSW